MHTANFEDKVHIVNLLTRSFTTNKSVRTVCKNEKSIPVLMKYCFVYSCCDQLAFINESKTAVALCKIPGREKFSLKKIPVFFSLLFSIGMRNSLQTLKKEKLISMQRSEKEYLHIIFIGVDPEKQGQKLGGNLLEEIKHFANSKNLPIYLETSTLANLPFYQKHGFDNFYTLKGVQEYDLYFFKYKSF